MLLPPRQRSQRGGGDLHPRGDVWQCLEVFSVVMTRGSAASLQWVRAKSAANYPAMHGAAPTTRNYLDQNVSSADVEKPAPCSAAEIGELYENRALGAPWKADAVWKWLLYFCCPSDLDSLGYSGTWVPLAQCPHTMVEKVGSGVSQVTIACFQQWFTKHLLHAGLVLGCADTHRCPCPHRGV